VSGDRKIGVKCVYTESFVFRIALALDDLVRGLLLSLGSRTDNNVTLPQGT